MALTIKAKRGLIAFLIFDVAVVAALIFLFVLKSERDRLSDLRELGVTVYPDVRPVQEFNLVDENLLSYTNENLANQWTLLFFGFTSCPDICPLTMAELKKFYEKIEDTKLKSDLNIAMISVDPERDDPETMGKYVNRFNDDFVGVTGELSDIAEMASQFFIAYSEPVHQHESTSEGDDQDENYLIDHSGHIAVVNPQGHFYAVMRPPHRANDLLKAYTMMRETAGN